MKNQYYAHSENLKGKKQSLHDHLINVAKKTEDSCSIIEYKSIFHLAGILHDLGKYQLDFQRYLESGDKKGMVPHSAWGAAFARSFKQNEISFAIDGHHKGLPDASNWKSDTLDINSKKYAIYEDLKQEFLSDLNINENDLMINKLSFKDHFERELFIRLLFSSLVDADWLDTEEHFKPDKYHSRKQNDFPVEKLIERLDAAIAEKSKEGMINHLRNKALEEVLKKSNEPVAFYSLKLPTGLGKTLISVSWALRHALKNGLQRIIIALPYVNIIDQTATILKKIFGADLVLEHHSGYNENLEIDDENIIDIKEKGKRLACENWDYPIIITTTVQFFESLFSNKPSRCRKIHNIANTVVIFDEVQTLPKEIILPTLNMLKNIHKLMNTTFLLCTATQPAFEKREGFDGINGIQHLIEEPKQYFENTKRVTYEYLDGLKPLSIEILSSHIEKIAHSVLCVFNTKRAAREFFNLMAKNKGCRDSYFHLSTAMCPAHRKNAIKNIIDALSDNRNIVVSSTQLIEAGVDFDFPCVFREIAPLESIIQSAGRCNREGKMPDLGKVFLFQLENSRMPDKAYRAYTDFALELINGNIAKLHQFNFFEEYYRDIIKLYVDPDSLSINEKREKFNFKEIADSYRLIKDATTGIYIESFNDESRKILDSVRYKEFLSREDYRKMQSYTVNVYSNFIKDNAYFCKEMPQGFLVWKGPYNEDIGISIELPEIDKYII